MLHIKDIGSDFTLHLLTDNGAIVSEQLDSVSTEWELVSRLANFDYGSRRLVAVREWYNGDVSEYLSTMGVKFSHRSPRGRCTR